MSPLTSFIIVVIAITLQFALYTLKRLQEPLEPRLPINPNKTITNNNKKDYWETAEITNGRLAMLGLLALVVNYGLFGWIVPGFV